MKNQEEYSYNKGFTNMYVLPGKEVPAEFTHKARGNSIIIPMVMDCEGTFFASSRFKACLLLSPIKYSYLDITCRLIAAGGVTIMERNWDSMSVSHFVTEHLFICGANLVRESPNVNVITNEILFEFSCMDNTKIVECGVQILSDETESSSGSEMDYFESGIIDMDDHMDRDEYYEPEGTQCKYTCFRSWLKKLWSTEENDDDKEENMNPHYDSKMMKKVFALAISLLLLYLVFP